MDDNSRGLDKNFIIETNKKIVEKWNEVHPKQQENIWARAGEVQDVIDMINSVVDEEKTYENLIKRSAYTIGYISWVQPFISANKRTGLLVAQTLIEESGYLLEIAPEDETYLRKLLYKVQEYRAKLDESVIAELILYISKHIKKT